MLRRPGSSARAGLTAVISLNWSCSALKDICNCVPYEPNALDYRHDAKAFGTPDKFPVVATTYRLTEHFHYWTKSVHTNAVLQPEMFVEMGERLAKAKGIADGDWVEISSQRGAIKAKACVTKRIRPIMVDGKPCDVVGLPIHFGFIGLPKLSLQATVGLYFLTDSVKVTAGGKTYVQGDKGVIYLGDPFTFDKSNITAFAKIY